MREGKGNGWETGVHTHRRRGRLQASDGLCVQALGVWCPSEQACGWGVCAGRESFTRERGRPQSGAVVWAFHCCYLLCFGAAAKRGVASLAS